MQVIKNYIVKGGAANWSSIKWQLVSLFLDICVNRWGYRNVPEEIPFYAPELSLFNQGQSVFAERGGAYFWLPSVIKDAPNMYGFPFEVDALSINGTEPIISNIRVMQIGRTLKDNKPLTGAEILNNVMRVSTLAILMPYIDRLDYLWSTMGINQALSRVQLVATCSKNNYDVYKRMIEKLLDKRDAVTLIKDKAQLEGIQIQDFHVEYMCDRYWYDFDKTFTQALTAIGIKSNFASQKKERLISAEVDANDAVIQATRDSFLKYREKGLETANKLYGLNMDISENEIDIDNLKSVTETPAE